MLLTAMLDEQKKVLQNLIDRFVALTRLRGLKDKENVREWKREVRDWRGESGRDKEEEGERGCEWNDLNDLWYLNDWNHFLGWEGRQTSTTETRLPSYFIYTTILLRCVWYVQMWISFDFIWFHLISFNFIWFEVYDMKINLKFE